VQGLDFTDVSASLATINGWVNEETNGKIPKILDSIDATNVMFLINALYFYGSWREKFDPSSTTDDVFTTAPGITQPMRLMHRHGEMQYVENSSYQAVDLPYGNSAFAMTVLLPRPGTDVEAISAGLTETGWQSLTSGFHGADVELALPKFRLEYARTMNDDAAISGLRAQSPAPPYRDQRPLSYGARRIDIRDPDHLPGLGLAMPRWSGDRGAAPVISTCSSPDHDTRSEVVARQIRSRGDGQSRRVVRREQGVSGVRRPRGTVQGERAPLPRSRCLHEARRFMLDRSGAEMARRSGGPRLSGVT
jgi:hypothetical protein